MTCISGALEAHVGPKTAKTIGSASMPVTTNNGTAEALVARID
jgi:hypothetical protein